VANAGTARGAPTFQNHQPEKTSGNRYPAGKIADPEKLR
jgi:hypothetical protein